MTAQMSEPRTINAVLDRVQASRADFDAAVARLTEEQFTAPGAGGDWSAKDVLAHVAAWEQGIAALLQHQPRGAAMGIEGDASTMDIDTINRHVYELHRERPASDVLAMAREAHERVVAVISTLDDADLQKPYKDFSDQQDSNPDEPIINAIAGDTYEHYEEHLPAIRAQAIPE